MKTPTSTTAQGELTCNSGLGFESLRCQLRDAGVLLFICNRDGSMNPATLHDAETRNDWITEFLCRSGMFQTALRHAWQQWATCDPTSPKALQAQQAMPGIWLVPPPVARRRHMEADPVAVVVTQSLLESEHFLALCQSVSSDSALARSLFEQLPPVHDGEVQRLVTLVRHLQTDSLQLAATEQAIDGTGRQLAESYEEISLLYTIIQSMNVVQQPDRFVTIACTELLNTLPYGWVGTLLADDRSRLKALAGKFISAGRTPERHSGRVAAMVNELLVGAVPDVPIILQPQNKPEHGRFAALGSTVVMHPVATDGHVVGLLIAGEKYGDDCEVSSVDIKLLGATATHMAIFLENAALYDDLNAMFLGTLEALTASIDAKDRYTCGHSQRVAHLTQQLAKAAGMQETQIKRMRIAGLVHDVGKIGVPERVLLKPGKLNEEEFEWIRKHPEIGHRILKDIPQLKDILPGVLHHHERWDGCGYPRGLQGEEIPMVARLIALADSFDAMSSTRTYRSGMNRKRVLKEIELCAGSQFDPELAEKFVQLDFSQYDRLVEDHRAGDAEQSDAGVGPRRAA